MKYYVVLGTIVVLLQVAIVHVSRASTESIGSNGIRSAGLTTADGLPLNGSGVSIGHVEGGRPGDPTFDDDNALFNSFVNPTAVFFRQPPPSPLPPFPPPNFDPMGEKRGHSTFLDVVAVDC
jgi:hypothetical protein